MKPGEVVTIRVNPRDCISVTDVVERLGIYPQGMSFSSAVAISLASMLEFMREHKVIPVRDGFEYGERMSPFSLKSRTSRKLSINKTLLGTNDEKQIPALVMDAAIDSPERAHQRRRLEELRIKLQGDELNFSEAEYAELRELTQEFFPEPT